MRGQSEDLLVLHFLEFILEFCCDLHPRCRNYQDTDALDWEKKVSSMHLGICSGGLVSSENLVNDEAIPVKRSRLGGYLPLHLTKWTTY